jgi:tetratricopeptide (TPR) repeat protein
VGDALQRLGDRAVADFTEVIRLNPRVAAAYANRSNTYTNQGDITGKVEYYDRAIEDLDEAVRLNPRWSYAYYKRGRAHNNRGDYQAALADYAEAL